MSGNFFNTATFINGIHTAMEFGQPNKVEDRATFYMPRTVTADGNKDSDGVPFNPNNNRTFSTVVKKTVKCAVEYLGGTGKDTNFGTLNPDKIKITMLGPDFVQVQGAEYVVVSGNKFLYWKSEPVIAAGGVDVHQTYWRSEDLA